MTMRTRIRLGPRVKVDVDLPMGDPKLIVV